MIYYIVNNDFHIEIIEGHIKNNKDCEISIIRIPHSLKNDCTYLSQYIYTVNTPLRIRKDFWNPFKFFKAKAIVDKIPFSSNDTIVFLTEYDAINQYVVYQLKKKGGNVILLEEGYSFYAIYIHDNLVSTKFSFRVKSFYLRYIIGFHFFKYIQIGSQNFPQMEDKYIDKMQLFNDVQVKRKIKKEIIESHYSKIIGLDSNKAVFLSQPLYQLYMEKDEFLKYLQEIIVKYSSQFELFYFKFHPRDSEQIKSDIKNNSKHLKNIVFVENEKLPDFINKEKPLYAFSFFSDALVKLVPQGLIVKFLFKNIPVLAKNENLKRTLSLVEYLESCNSEIDNLK